MEFAIIAAGEGSRLREEGFALPKPLLPLNGVPLIQRLIHIFAAEQAHRVHIIINKHSPELKSFLSTQDFPVDINLIEEDTASSLHSFAVLVDNNPTWEFCCLTTTDTVFRPDEFHRYLEAFRKDTTADAMMAITPFVDDESPLYVKVDKDLNINSFLDDIERNTTYVSGGIYCLRKNAIACATRSVAAGNSRMRNFQRDLIAHDLRVKGFVFDKVVDVDHWKDKALAEEFLKEELI